MGLNIKEILKYEEIPLEKIKGKKIAIDAFNMIYQFLASIRQPDGTPLRDSNGNVTSHLKGLFNRCVFFKKNNILPIFVFDGKPPALKEKERLRRMEVKMKAETQYREALEAGDIEAAKKYSQATSKITTDMVEESKTLISLFGFPVIQAPSEGEAQAAYLVKKKIAWASASQDFDSLLFGASYLIRNLSIGRRRKVAGTNLYKDSPIEFYSLKDNLEHLGLDIDGLIILAILCGTDYNPGGIKGVGPKKALLLVKSYANNWDELFKRIGWDDTFNFSWVEVYNTFKNMKTYDIEGVVFDRIRKKEIVELLAKRDFDKESVENSLAKISDVKTLDNFF